MYLDPGLGSMLVQALVGIAAVVGSAFFMFRQKLTALFGRKDKSGETTPTDKQP